MAAAFGHQPVRKKLAGSLPASVTIIRTLLFGWPGSCVSSRSSSWPTRLKIAFIRSVSYSRRVLSRSVQEHTRQVEHMGAIRLGRTDALRDEFYLRRSVSTDRAREQIEHIVLVARKRLGAAIRHQQHDRISYQLLFERLDPSVQLHRLCFEESAISLLVPPVTSPDCS